MLDQKLHYDLSLSQVLVFSDGSTDSTPTVISEWVKRDPRIELRQSSRRLGKPTVINEIFKLAHGDVVVLIDADTMPVGDTFVSEMTTSFKNNSDLGIVAAIGIPLPSKSLVGRAAVFSSNVRRRLVWVMPYFAFNVAIAISAKIAKTVSLPSRVIGDDAYLYFKTQRQGLKIIVSQNAKILYREPQTLRDFVVQRKKYDLNVAQLRQFFGNQVREQIKIPKKLWIVFLQEMIRDPVAGFFWLLLRGFLKLRRTADSEKVTNSVALSTKGGLSPHPKNNNVAFGRQHLKIGNVCFPHIMVTSSSNNREEYRI